MSSNWCVYSVPIFFRLVHSARASSQIGLGIISVEQIVIWDLDTFQKFQESAATEQDTMTEPAPLIH